MENPAYFTRLPESMEHADIGPYFRGLREHYKLSEHDVSARLHIRVKYIQAIEASDMSQLPGKVYARGYVATYAEFLGIDPEQAVERLLGSETKEKVEEYFVPEPARLDTGLQQKIRMAIVAILAIALFYAWISAPGNDEEESTVVPVPQSLVESSRGRVMPIDRSLRCVQGALTACLQPAWPQIDGHPLHYPDIFTAEAAWKPAAPKKPELAKPAPAPKTEKPVKVIRPEPKTEEAESVLPWLQ